MAFVSPIASTRNLLHPLSTTIGSLGVHDLLEVFLELEELDDKLPRPAVVHGRKKLQALANRGTTHTEILYVITIDAEDDTRTTTNNQQPPEAVENSQPLQLPRRQTPVEEELVPMNEYCFEYLLSLDNQDKNVLQIGRGTGLQKRMLMQ